MENRIGSILLSLNEIQRRHYLGAEAKSYGWGGVSAVSRASGVSRATIGRGLREVEAGLHYVRGGRIRIPGGGRAKLVDKYSDLKDNVKSIVKDATYGDPETTKILTSLSLRKISSILKENYNITVSHVTVGNVLNDIGYSRQQNKKYDQVGKESEFRNEQFEFINDQVNEFTESGDPVISVDCKKKENLGNYQNKGSEYRKKNDPRKVLDHDFPDPDLGKAVPYGIYDIRHNFGFVSLGNSAETAEFAATSIERWWVNYGKQLYPHSQRMLITCDCGGSNGYRVHLWKLKISELSRRIGLDIHVTHYPTGTSKYNKIEHRLFSHISKSWQGKPLLNLEITKKYIESTSTTTGLKVACEIDRNVYRTGIKVGKEDLQSIKIIPSETIGKWNYCFPKSI